MRAAPPRSAMLLFDDSKKLEKAHGEEAAAVIAHVFEKADDTWRQELATKADWMATKAELQAEIAQSKAELRAELAQAKAELRADLAATENRILRWMVGGFLAQTALIVAVMALQR